MTESDASGPDTHADSHGADATDSGAVDRAAAGLERVRTEPGPHAAAVVLAVGLGLLLSWFHWFGLVLGGALVALTAATPWRGVAGAVGFGALVLVAFALSLGGSVGAVLEMTPVVYLVVVSAFGLPVLGSFARGLV